MTIQRQRDWAYPGNFSGEDKAWDYIKQHYAEHQEESASRISDFNILRLSRVPWVDVRRYGAVGDGSTDDATSIQAALDAASADGIGRVYLPQNTYSIGTPLTIPSNMTVFGDGWNSIIQLAASTNNHVIKNNDQTSGNDEITIDGLRIEGNKTNQTTAGYGVHFVKVNEFTIRNCWVSNTFHTGIFIQECNRFWVLNNRVSAAGQAADNSGNNIDVRANCQAFHIRGNLSHNALSNGIRVHRISVADNFYGVIDGNLCYSNGHIGIAVADSQEISVVNNVCFSNTNNGLDFNGLSRAHIVGNLAFSNGIHGINPDTCTEVSVIGNQCRNNQRNGIYLVSVDNSVVNSNICINNGQEENASFDDGIQLNNSDKNVVSGNRCTDDQGAATQDTGILEAGTSDYNTITSNSCSGNVTDSYGIIGANTVHGLNEKVIRDLWIAADGVRGPTTKPATWKEWGISGVWEFSDGTDDTVVGAVKFPNDMDMSVAPSVKVGWSTATTVTTETATWQLEYLYRQIGEDTTAAAQATIPVDSNAVATAHGLIVATFPAMDTPNASDVCVHMRIKRLGAGGNDDLTDTAELHGVCLEYTSNRLGTPL